MSVEILRFMAFPFQGERSCVPQSHASPVTTASWEHSPLLSAYGLRT